MHFSLVPIIFSSPRHSNFRALNFLVRETSVENLALIFHSPQGILGSTARRRLVRVVSVCQLIAREVLDRLETVSCVEGLRKLQGRRP